jgi:hypothetical protein
MSVTLIQERLARYGCASTLEEDRALREITQEGSRYQPARGGRI